MSDDYRICNRCGKWDKRADLFFVLSVLWGLLSIMTGLIGITFNINIITSVISFQRPIFAVLYIVILLTFLFLMILSAIMVLSKHQAK